MFSQRPGAALGPGGIGAPASPFLCSAVLQNPQAQQRRSAPCQDSSVTVSSIADIQQEHLRDAASGGDCQPGHPTASNPASFLPQRLELSESPDRGGGTAGQEGGWHRLTNVSTAGTRGWSRPRHTEVTAAAKRAPRRGAAGTSTEHGPATNLPTAAAPSRGALGAHTLLFSLFRLPLAIKLNGEAAGGDEAPARCSDTAPEPATGELPEGTGSSSNPGRPLGWLIQKRHEPKNGTNLE